VRVALLTEGGYPYAHGQRSSGARVPDGGTRRQADRFATTGLSGLPAPVVAE
jgi:hypothetical protein